MLHFSLGNCKYYATIIAKAIHACRLDNLIMEAITDLKEPGGSNKTTIATYIEVIYSLFNAVELFLLILYAVFS